MAAVGVLGDCVCGGSSSHPNFEGCERCRLVWFVVQVKEMREAQRAYFKDRGHDNLKLSMDRERLVDKAVEKLTRVQGELFDDEQS